MVREVKLSPECPPQPVDHESLLDEEFAIVDDWTGGEEPPSARVAAPRPRSSGAGRNLAGVVTAKPVAVKSRRRRRGRRADPAGSKPRQISIAVTDRDWRLLRDEAARERIPIAELCRRWFRPHLDQLDFQRSDAIKES